METFRDDSEESIGITTYLGRTTDGFSAISKARFSDFVVHEVGVDGRQARLESTSPDIIPTLDGGEAEKMEVTPVVPPSNEKKRKTPSGQPVDWESVSTQLEELVGGESTKQVVSFLQAIEDPSSISKDELANHKDTQFVVLPTLADKDKRRGVHNWVRENLSEIALSDTAEGQQIRIWHVSHRKSMPHKHDRRDNGGSNRAPRPPKGYLQFVLYKENMDTGSAIQYITRRLGNGGNNRGGRGGGNRRHQQVRMGFSGSKDKRGVTAQFITVRSTDCTPEKLCRILNGDREGGGHTKTDGASLVRVGNFEFVKQELRLGRLKGNRFDVVLRNVQCKDPTTIPKHAVKTIKQTGFVNYFGTQRFGKKFDTHLIGMAILKNDYQGAVDLILSPKLGDEKVDELFKKWTCRFDDDPKDRATVEKNHARELLKAMNRFMHSESAVLNALIRKPLDYKSAFGNITKTMRMMFIHALQSFLFNKVASFRIRELGMNVVEGDLVLSQDMEESATEQPGIPEVHVVTDEDLKNRTYTMEDVVLPLIGIKTRDPANGCSEHFDTLLKENNLTRDMINLLKDRDFNCAGDYRKLLCRPSDVDFQLIRYNDELAPLLETDFMKIQGIKVEEDPNGPLFALRVGFSLPSSSYATIFLRELMKRPTSMDYQSALKLGGS